MLTKLWRTCYTSGYTLDGQVSLILERGCNGFIQKPFKPVGLSQEIRQILGNPFEQINQLHDITDNITVNAGT